MMMNATSVTVDLLSPPKDLMPPPSKKDKDMFIIGKAGVEEVKFTLCECVGLCCLIRIVANVFSFIRTRQFSLNILK